MISINLRSIHLSHRTTEVTRTREHADDLFFTHKTLNSMLRQHDSGCMLVTNFAKFSLDDLYSKPQHNSILQMDADLH